MNKPTLQTYFVVEMHDDLIASYGGATGLREASLLSSALGHAGIARQLSDPSVYDLAAIYCYHLCMNHPFVDGNKRTACATMLMFLALHDLAFVDPMCDAVTTMVAIANKEMDKQQLAEWIEGWSWQTKPLEVYDLPTIYQEIKVYHDALFRRLAEV